MGRESAAARSPKIHINLDAITAAFPRKLIDEILESEGRTSRRERKLPAHLMMYYVITLGLLSSTSSREVLRVLTQRLRGAIEWESHWVATRSAITQARQRLGPEPLKKLFEICVRVAARRDTIGAWFGRLRLVALDGSSFTVPDSEANARTYGKPAVVNGKTAPYPKVRFIALAELGTEIIFAVKMAPWRTSEVALAREVIPKLDKGMLCIADRLFYGFELWREAVATGAELLWRVQKTIALPKLKVLPDGSYLSEVRPRSNASKAEREKSLPVRVIEFTLTVREKRTFYRAITTLLDPKSAPARDLAQLYARRWGIETIFSEVKRHLRGRALSVRSERPDLVEQEVYGLLLAHFGLRSVMHEAAREQNVAPTELSFVHAVRVVARNLPEMAFFSPLRQFPAPA